MDKCLKLANGQRFEFLDGLRGIAALLVTCLHFHTLIIERTSADFPLFFEYLFMNGNFGVQIFFVLSGFVIAYSIRNEYITPSFLMRFFLKRSIRLDPPYWIALCLMTGLIFFGSVISHSGNNYMPTVKTFTLNAFYLPGFFGADYILPVAWTLCLEFQFYIFFVLMIKAIQHLNRWKGYDAFDYSSIFGLLLLSPFLIGSLIEAVEWSKWNNVAGLFLPFWYSFFCGSFVCWMLLDYIKKSVFWIAMLCVALISITEMHADMIVTLMVSIMIWIVAKRNYLHRILNQGVFQYLGKVSYSLYLIHWPIGIKFMTFLLFVFGEEVNAVPSLVLMMIALGFTLLATHCFYKLVEYPSLQLSKWREKFQHRATEMHRETT